MGTEVQSLTWFKWTPYAILPLFSLFLSILTFRLGYKNRQTSGAPEFILVCLGIALYSFGYFWEIVSTKPDNIIFWDNFQFIGPDVLIIALPFLCLRMANLNRFIHPISGFLFSIIPICTEFVVWFGEEEWIRPSLRFDPSAPWLALIYEYGPWMQVYVINFLSIFLICIIILLYGAWSQRAFHRIRCLVFLIGISIPFGSQIMTAGGFIPFIHPKLDIFPLAAGFALIVWMYGLFYFKILNLIPLARNQVFEYIQDAVFVMNSSGFLLDCNVSALNLLGTARLRQNSKLSEFLPDLDVLVDECHTNRKANTEWKTNHGKYYDVSVRSQRAEGSQFTIVVLRDVTQRAISERKLSERRDILQSILDSTSILFLVLDGDGKLILLNRACLQTTGFDLMELEGKVFWETELFAEESKKIAKVFEQRFAKKKFPKHTSVLLRTKDGKSRRTLWEHKEVRDRNGHLQYVISTGTDATGLEEAEFRIETLQRANEEILAQKAIIESQKFDLEDVLQNLKRTQAKLIQASKLADLGQLAAGIAHEINNPIGAIQAAGYNILSYLEKIRTELRPILPILSSISDEDWISFNELITLGVSSKEILIGLERRRILAEIRTEMKSADILFPEETAEFFVDYGIASSWRNFERILRNRNTRELLPFFLNLLGPEQCVDTIKTAVDRSAKIVYALRSFAHFESSHKKRKFSLKENIDTVLTLYQNLFKHGVEVSTNLDGIPEFLGFPDDLMHLWTNLIMNSVQAMSYKGSIGISASLQKNEVIVSIQDKGPGIPAEVQDQVFDAFFTTKPLGEGSGLGLDIAKRIVEKHKGRIWFESSPGNTIFYVGLPFEV
ncbi:PAS domain-containing sensor histidine kinase [Leptospira hartskeerlii]|uniref:histidine kinase n=1 Tax=Leptospira hartskeerlii TaxID=2023177 RepID=A0A2M9XAF4_9LEPT|nr:histidine kinase N-terminal 7TM domain-containing protein [Leptospira hartskeerlii]PJZ24634.1 PAS domain-containing sensor histidine kinase [Leptospira hartskeerlii]PJZ33276.1 PAS domain-containing sensor histidine kinase [Leptospira hartskeerlii]